MIETEVVLGSQEAFLDRPAQASCGGQFGQRGVGCESAWKNGSDAILMVMSLMGGR
jgi:hypothetical protein